MKISVLIPHFKTFRWTATCIWHFKQFGMPVPSEIILVDNSPGHPSIKAITETELCDGIRLLDGDPEFSSHGNALDIAAREADGTHFFTAETDSFPTRHGYFDEYVKAVGDGYDLIGPEIPQSSGRYVHPAGALLSRKVYEAALAWQERMREWFFCPGGAVMMRYSDRPYHVVAHASELPDRVLPHSALETEISRWAKVGPYQEMRTFNEDTFENYGQRTGAETVFDPGRGLHYLKIGYEAGQWLAYFAEAHGFKVMRAPTRMEWMDGREGQQAAGSTVFDSFRHVWAGTSALAEGGLEEEVRQFKFGQCEEWFAKLPEKLRDQIISLERRNS
jgi:hypothetical protein